MQRKKKYNFDWYEESFTALKGTRDTWELPRSKEFLSNLFTQKKCVGAIVLVGFFLAVMVGRVIQLQLVHGEYYKALADGNRVRIRPLVSERGNIFDHKNRKLVENIPIFSITLSPGDLPHDVRERAAMIQKIALIIRVPEEELSATLSSFEQYRFEEITIRENIEYEDALKMLVNSVDIRGLGIRRQSQREYLFDNIKDTTPAISSTTPHSLSHILGYESKIHPQELEHYYARGYLPTDFIGRTGIEAIFEDFLRGDYGKKFVEVDALGVEQVVLAEEPPLPGKHIKLTIDRKAQNKLEQILAHYLALNHKTRGSALAIDPQTGSLIALVSLPAFNSNLFAQGISKEHYQKLTENEDRPLFNRAISGVYPSGSVIKPFIAAAALEEGIITKNTSFLSTGGIEIGGRIFPDWKEGGHGMTNVVKAIAESVNTFFYIIGGGKDGREGLGVKRIDEYFEKFEFGKRLGIELPGEATGRVPTPEWKEKTLKEPWYVGDTYNLSIGQGDLLVTPLHIAYATAAIANGGTVYRPRIVEEVIDPVSEVIQMVEPRALTGPFIDPYNISIVQEGMRACVQEGSCRALQSLGVSMAGKTGTAQWSNTRETHAWFTGYAPYKTPTIVITVLIEEGGEGSAAALPVARDFLLWWFEYFKE